MSDDDNTFQERMTVFLRSSPMIPPPIPTRCADCTEYHIIADDLVYCVTCHYPIRKVATYKVAKVQLIKRGILDRILGK